jgi:hypothetical protein
VEALLRGVLFSNSHRAVYPGPLCWSRCRCEQERDSYVRARNRVGQGGLDHGDSVVLADQVSAWRQCKRIQVQDLTGPNGVRPSGARAWLC